MKRKAGGVREMRAANTPKQLGHSCVVTSAPNACYLRALRGTLRAVEPGASSVSTTGSDLLARQLFRRQYSRFQLIGF